GRRDHLVERLSRGHGRDAEERLGNAVPTDEDAAVVAERRVVAVAAGDPVVAVAADQDVVLAVAEEDVVAGTAVDRVVALAAVDFAAERLAGTDRAAVPPGRTGADVGVVVRGYRAGDGRPGLAHEIGAARGVVEQLHGARNDVLVGNRRRRVALERARVVAEGEEAGVRGRAASRDEPDDVAVVRDDRVGVVRLAARGCDTVAVRVHGRGAAVVAGDVAAARAAEDQVRRVGALRPVGQAE